MNYFSSAVLLGLLATAACQSNDKPAAGTSDTGAETAVRQRVDQMAAAYNRKDLQAFVAMTDPDGSIIYGTDSAEVNVGQDAIRQQMQDDFASVDSLRMGTMANYHSQTAPTLATAFFDSPVMAYDGGHAYPGMVRFATVWHKRDDGNWYLAQTLVSRPTKGESSREMVARRKASKAGKMAAKSK